MAVALHALVSTTKRAEKDLSIPDQLKQTAGVPGFEPGWLPDLSPYRTMCIAPDASFRRVLEEARELRLAA